MPTKYYQLKSDGDSRKTWRKKLNHKIGLIEYTFKEIQEEIDQYETLCVYNCKRLKMVLEIMSNLMPKIKDTTLTEIDDLIYPDEKQLIKGCDSKTFHKYLIESKFTMFENYYISLVMNRNNDIDPELNEESFQIMDTVYLQMIENAENMFDRNPLTVVCALATSRLYLCQAIKVLKAVVNRGTEYLKELPGTERYAKYFVWLSRLKDIPEGKDEQTKRITSFLKYQSNLIFSTRFNADYPTMTNFLEENEKLQNRKTFDENFVKLLRGIKAPFLQVDHLYRYFSSAQKDEEKLQRKIDFLRGITEDDGTIINEFLSMFGEVENYFFNDKCKYSESVMKQIDKYHCNDLEPFITTNDSTDCHEDLLDNEHNEQADFTVERFLFYDGFLKGLYVVWKIYDACMSHKDILQSEMVKRAFLSKHITSFLKRKLEDPSIDLPWWYQTSIKKCPFLVVSKSDEHMVDDISRLMSGQILDDTTWESLYFISTSRASTAELWSYKSPEVIPLFGVELMYE